MAYAKVDLKASLNAAREALVTIAARLRTRYDAFAHPADILEPPTEMVGHLFDRVATLLARLHEARDRTGMTSVIPHPANIEQAAHPVSHWMHFRLTRPDQQETRGLYEDVIRLADAAKALWKADERIRAFNDWQGNLKLTEAWNHIRSLTAHDERTPLLVVGNFDISEGIRARIQARLSLGSTMGGWVVHTDGPVAEWRAERTDGTFCQWLHDTVGDDVDYDESSRRWKLLEEGGHDMLPLTTS